MVEKKPEKLNILTAEQRQKLINLDKQIAYNEKVLALLREMGLGTRELEDKIAWSKKRLDILLNKG